MNIKLIYFILSIAVLGSNSVERESHSSGKNNPPMGFIVTSLGFDKTSQNTAEMIAHRQRAIVDVVWTADQIEQKKAYWNKLFYDYLHLHHVINEQEETLIKDALHDEGVYMENNPVLWPENLSVETFNRLYGLLGIDFSRFEEVENIHTKKYLIRFNEKFWNIKKLTKKNVLNDILNQKIYLFEQFYDDYNLALENGLILTTAVCVYHDFENAYWYAQKVNEQLRSKSYLLTNHGIKYKDMMPIFKFDMLIHDEAERMKQYETIKQEESKLLHFYKELYLVLEEKPFEIVDLTIK